MVGLGDVIIGGDGCTTMLGTDMGDVIVGGDGCTTMLGTDMGDVIVGGDGCTTMLGNDMGDGSCCCVVCCIGNSCCLVMRSIVGGDGMMGSSVGDELGEVNEVSLDTCDFGRPFFLLESLRRLVPLLF